MRKTSGTICGLILFVPLTGCHHAFTQSSVQIRKWQLDDDAHVVARSEFSECKVSHDPSLNYNRLTIEVLNSANKRLYLASAEVGCSTIQPEWELGNFVARADEARQTIMLSEWTNGKQGFSIIIPRTSEGVQVDSKEKSFDIDRSVKLKEIPS
jgi:hypothetical protein